MKIFIISKVKEKGMISALIVLGLMCIALGGVLLEGYVLHLFILSGIYMILTIGFSLLFGQGGIISLAHAAFFGIGAYATTILEIRYGMPALAGLPVSFAIPGFIAYLMGKPLMRLRHLYLAIGTLAFSEICLVFFKQPIEFTGGYTGLSGIPNIALGTFIISDREMDRYYYLTCFILALVLFVAIALMHGKVGRALRALRDNETAAQAMGIDPMEYKTYIFSFASACAGVAGWLYAHYAGAISPPLFGTNFSIVIMLMLFIGGLRSLWGAALGAIFLAFVPAYVGRLGQYEHIVYGILLILVLMFMPRGLLGVIEDTYQKMRSRLQRTNL